MSAIIQIHDQQFVPYLSAVQIQHGIQQMAHRISHDLAGETPIFVVVLNGAVFFAADLLRHITLPCELTFIKTRSYQGMHTTGQVAINWIDQPMLRGRTVVIIEDIVDTGHTLHQLLPLIATEQPQQIHIACLLQKPDACRFPDLQPRYVAFQIPNKFVVGYGLDYDGLGRNLPDIWQPA